jgi:hypothetical protein
MIAHQKAEDHTSSSQLRKVDHPKANSKAESNAGQRQWRLLRTDTARAARALFINAIFDFLLTRRNGGFSFIGDATTGNRPAPLRAKYRSTNR